MKEGQTYAHIAAADEDIGSLINILENECSLIDATDDQGHTPLSLALIRDKLFSAKTLISNGCKVNIGGGHTYVLKKLGAGAHSLSLSLRKPLI